MDTSKKPLWIQHVEDTVSKPTGSEYMGTSGSTLPFRYNNVETAKDSGSSFSKARSKHSSGDTTSLLSRSSGSSRSEKHAARRLGLVLILIVIAFIIAVAIGVLAYFLLLSDPPASFRSVTVADSTVRVLNETYKDAMADKSSLEFRRIADPFCDEVSSYFSKTKYHSRFNECRVIEIRDLALSPDCVCYTSSKGAIEIAYQLVFLGSLGDVKRFIPEVLEKHSTKLTIGDVVHVLIKYFLVDMRVSWNVPYNAIQSELTLQVYNLTYSDSLQYHNSTAFLRHAIPFCADIDEFLQNSYLGYRYYDCEVTMFGNRPTRVSIALRFTGREPRPIQTGLIYIIMSSARNYTADGHLLKIIGDLLVTPYDPTHILTPTNITRQPTTTTSLLPVTPTAPWGNAVYVTTPLLVYNLTYVTELGDPGTTQFNKLARPFCKDLERMYILYSQFKDRYYNCEVTMFKDKPVRIEFTLVFRGTDSAGLQDSVVRVIRRGAPKNIFENKVVHLVGTIWVILGQDDQSIGLTSLPWIHSTITDAPTLTSIYLYYNGLRLDTYLRVYNLTYTYELADPSSWAFQYQDLEFCKDLRIFYSYSEFSERFFDCELKTISPDPIFFFHLVFWGRNEAGIKSSVVSVIRRYAERVLVDLRWMFKVGNVLVLPEDMFVTVIPTNITMTETSTIMSTVTSTIQMTPAVSSSVYVVPPNYVNITFEYLLYRFDYDPRLSNSNSELFNEYMSMFCREMSDIYERDPVLTNLYAGCIIEWFRDNPDAVRFHVVFKTRYSPTLADIVRRTLEGSRPHFNVSESRYVVYEIMPVGGLVFILRNNSVTPETTTAYTTTEPPTTTPWQPEITSNVTLNYLLYRFDYDPRLSNPESDLFMQYNIDLCKELSKIYSQDSVLMTLYYDCQLDSFRESPDTVRFHVVFKTRYSHTLADIVRRTLEGSRPHFNVSESRHIIYEVMPVGEFVFILRNLTVTPETTTSTSTTETPTTTTQPPITSNVTLNYLLYNFNYDPSLMDPESDQFIEHNINLCKELSSIYSQDAVLKDWYYDCQIDRFRDNPNSVRFHVVIKTRYSPTLVDIVRRTLEGSRPHFNVSESRYVVYEIMPVGGLVFILRNLSSVPETTTSTTTTEPSTTTTEPLITSNVTLQYLLYRFNYDPSLSHPESDRFTAYNVNFCRELSSIYSQDAVLKDWYYDCQIDKFRDNPDSVRFHVVFKTRYSPTLADIVRRTLEGSRPHFNVSESRYVVYEIMPVGGLVFILRNNSVTPETTTLPTTTEAVTSPAPITTTVPPITSNVTLNYLLYKFDYNQNLSNPESDIFMEHNINLCKELSAIYSEDAVLRSWYYDCQIDKFRDNPDAIRFHVVFKTRYSPTLVDIVRRTLEGSRPHFNVSESRYVVYEIMPVGGLVFILRNLSVTPETTTPTTTTEKVTTPPPTTTVPPITSNVTLNYLLYRFNYDSSLSNPESERFMLYNADLCKELSSIFSQDAVLKAWYYDCQIDSFRDNPDAIRFHVVFKTRYSPTLVDIVRRTLEGSRPHFNVSESRYVVYEIMPVGGLVFILRNLSVTPETTTLPTTTEGLTTPLITTTTVPPILSNVTLNYLLYRFRYDPSLSNPESDRFTQYNADLCKELSSIYSQDAVLKAWYYDCQIDRFRDNPDAVRFHIVFKTRYSPTLVDIVRRTLEGSRPHFNVSESRYVVYEIMPVGGLVFILRNLSVTPETTTLPTTTEKVTTPSTTTVPPILSNVTLNYLLYRFRYDPSLSNPESDRFTQYNADLCKELASIYSEDSVLKTWYHDCQVDSFRDNPDAIRFHVVFKTRYSPTLVDIVRRTLEGSRPHFNVSESRYVVYEIMPVGGLVFILRNLSVTPETTTLPTTTEKVTTPPPTTTVPPILSNVTLNYLLYRFRYDPSLSNPESDRFTQYNADLCKELSSIYADDAVLKTWYHDCQIDVFRDNPDAVRFHVVFKTRYSPTLVDIVRRTLEGSRPHFNVSESRYVVYEIMPVGGLVFILRNLSVTPETTTLPTTTEVVTSPPTTTSTVPPITANVSLAYQLYRFRYDKSLENTNSKRFKYYNEMLCKELSNIYKQDFVLTTLYHDCQIDWFRDNPDSVRFHVVFKTRFSHTLADIVKRTLEGSRPHFNVSESRYVVYEIMPVEELVFILRNLTVTPETTVSPSTTEPVTSPPTTTTPLPDWIQARIVWQMLDFPFFPDLMNRNSTIFRLYQIRFCSDVKRFYMNSYLGNAFRKCEITEFNQGPPDTISFEISFDTPLYPQLLNNIITIFLREAPRLNISGYNVLNVGNIHLIVDKFNATVVDIEASTTLIVTPSSTHETTMKSLLSISPTSPMDVSSTAQTGPLDEWVLAIFKFGLLEFVYYPSLANKDSELFNIYQRRFCEDIAKFYSGSYLSGAYRDCQITEFYENPDAIKFFIAFETGLFPELQADILHILERRAPKSNISDYTVLNIGDLFLIWSNFTYELRPPVHYSTVYTWITTPSAAVTQPTAVTVPTTTEFIYEIKLSFEVLNIRYTPDLNNLNSLTFRRHQQLSCDDISALLLAQPKKYAGYKGCRVDKFLSDPLRVYFSLVFSDQQADETSQRVEALLVEVADRENFYDMVALQVGDLVVAVDNFTVQHNGTLTTGTTPAVKYDAILYNYTFHMYHRNYSEELHDPSSQLYRTVSDSFCRDIMKYYMGSYLNERYFSCKVQSFGNRLDPYMNVHVIFDGTYDYGSSIVFDVVNVSAPAFNVGGIRMIRVGNLLVYPKSLGKSILIRWSDVTTAAPPVTEFPVLYTQFDVSVVVKNLSYSWDLADRTSSRFRVLAADFCQQMDIIFSPKFPEYFGCVVEAFRSSPVGIVFSLRFRGIQDAKMEKLVSGLLYDNGWHTVGGTMEFALGRLRLDPTTIQIKIFIIQNGKVINEITVPTTLPVTPPPITTPAGTNPCHPNRSGFVRHPIACDSFFICDSGTVVNQMRCASGQVFNSFMCAPRPPGFVCVPSL